jgi:hypothetical protein
MVKFFNVFRAVNEWVHEGVPIHILVMEGRVQIKCFETRVSKQECGS